METVEAPTAIPRAPNGTASRASRVARDEPAPARASRPKTASAISTHSGGRSTVVRGAMSGKARVTADRQTDQRPARNRSQHDPPERGGSHRAYAIGPSVRKVPQKGLSTVDANGGRLHPPPREPGDAGGESHRDRRRQRQAGVEPGDTDQPPPPAQPVADQVDRVGEARYAPSRRASRRARWRGSPHPVRPGTAVGRRASSSRHRRSRSSRGQPWARRVRRPVRAPRRFTAASALLVSRRASASRTAAPSSVSR